MESLYIYDNHRHLHSRKLWCLLIYYLTYKSIHQLSLALGLRPLTCCLRHNTFDIENRYKCLNVIQPANRVLFQALLCFQKIDTRSRQGKSGKSNILVRMHHILDHYCDVITGAMGAIKENIKAPRHWPLCGELTGEFPAQMASNTENISIWWRHHDSSNPWPGYKPKYSIIIRYNLLSCSVLTKKNLV